MKKVLALVLAIITVLTLSVIPFTASAAEGKNPTFTADKNLIAADQTAVKGYTGANWFFGQAGGGLANIADKNYAGTIDTITAKKASAGTYVTDGLAARLQNAGSGRPYHFTRPATGEPALTADENMLSGMYLHVSDTPVKMNSCLLAGAALESFLYNNLPDGFDVYVGTAPFVNVDGATTKDTNVANFKLAVSVKNLVTDGKYVDSADKKFSYYEVNFDKEMEGTDIAFYISANNYATVKAAYDAGKTDTANTIFTEFAVFADKLPVAEQTEAKTEEQKPADNTGDTSMLLGMILVGAVAFTASVAVIKKKEENV